VTAAVPRIELPDGARGVDADGNYTARPGDRVNVSTGHAAAIAARASRAMPGERFVFGTKRGQVCPTCRRRWNAWSAVCPRCGADTVEDE
jgi:hypothetical protein